MISGENWKSALPGGTTLRVFSGDKLIFSSSGRWLMPLFELEEFMQTYCGPRTDLSAHDTAIGKAAAVIMIRLGITRIHANLASTLARGYIDFINSERAVCPADGTFSAGSAPFAGSIRSAEAAASPADNASHAEAGASIELIADRTVDKLLCATEDQLEHMTSSDDMYRILRQRAKLVRGADVVVEHLSCPYGAIQDLSFKLPAGGNLLIIGENGAGKTTLLRSLTGNLAPQQGHILIDGKPPRSIAPRTVCYVPQQQDSVLFPLSVEEVVSLGIPRSEKNAKALIKAAMERTGCAELYGRSFSTLSGGEKQKVSLARCLAQNAKVLLLDEPTSALDDDARIMVAAILRSLSVTEIPTIITVTHDRELVHQLGWQALTLGDAA